MGESDLRASNLAKSARTAERDALATAEAKRIVEERVESELRSFTNEEKRDFLLALEEHGNVHKACVLAGITRRSAVTARKRDPLFSQAWSEILEGHVDGVEEVLYQQCLNVSSANTVARIFYLKAARRGKYGDQVTVEQKHKVNVEVVLGKPSDDAVSAAQLSPGVIEAEFEEIE